jgi:hypothetical protein
LDVFRELRETPGGVETIVVRQIGHASITPPWRQKVGTVSV